MMTEYPRPTAKISPANWRSSYSADPFESVRTLSTLVSKSESVPLPKSMGSQARIFDCNAQTLCEDNVSTSQMTINRTFSPIRPMKCGRSANNASTSPLNSRTSNILVHSSETGPLNPTGRRDEILFFQLYVCEISKLHTQLIEFHILLRNKHIEIVQQSML